MSIQADYEARCRQPSDINEHMPALHDLARDALVICEFGVRSGNSTAAFLAGLASGTGGTLHSFDRDPPKCAFPGLPDGVEWRFSQADTATLAEIPPCNLLFVDTLHDAAQVEAELKHAPSVRTWLVFHDTVLFGSRDESTGRVPGICHAIFGFLASPEGLKWEVFSHDPGNNGLLILKRR